ncbi:hypothetical protein Rs2_22999 [Raphanus sativus]|nr:hypothetical protein Rs2_22999 [Raphanus sativus]
MVFLSTKKAGLGWIFSHPNGQARQGSTAIACVQSALQAEALAIRASLQHALDLGYTNIWFRSDSLGLIQAIDSAIKPKDLYGIFSDVESPSAFLLRYFFQRTLNQGTFVVEAW